MPIVTTPTVTASPDRVRALRLAAATYATGTVLTVDGGYTAR
jgi:hypothetical protein